MTAYTSDWDGFYPYREAAEQDVGSAALLKTGGVDDRPMIRNHVAEELDDLQCPFSLMIAPEASPSSSSANQIVYSYEMWFGQPIVRGSEKTRLFRTNDRPAYNGHSFATLMADADRNGSAAGGGHYQSAHPDADGVLEGLHQTSGWWQIYYWNGGTGVERSPLPARHFLQKDGHVRAIYDVAVDDDRTASVPYRNNEPWRTLFGYLPPVR